MTDRIDHSIDDVDTGYVLRKSFRHHRTGRIIVARPGSCFRIPVRGKKPLNGK